MTLGDELLELDDRIALVDDLVADVRPVEARDELRRTAKLQPLDDLFARQLVGGRGQRDARHVGKALGDDRQRDIFGAEVMAPLRDAMRLVDREQRDLGSRQQRQAARRHQPLRRHIEQVEIARDQAPLDLGGLLQRQ